MPRACVQSRKWMAKIFQGGNFSDVNPIQGPLDQWYGSQKPVPHYVKIKPQVYCAKPSIEPWGPYNSICQFDQQAKRPFFFFFFFLG